MSDNYFNNLNAVNVNDKIEKKGGLSYLAWAYAWGELKKQYPMSYYTIYENADGWFYHTDGRFGWVKTGVTLVDGESQIEHIEYLPIMDYKNNSITADRITSFDVNKAIQRSLTKAVARHGLGLYIYAGEDLPDEKDGTADERMSVKAEEVAEFQDAQISEKDAKNLIALIESYGASVEEVCKAYKVADVKAMSKSQYANCVKLLEQKYNK